MPFIGEDARRTQVLGILERLQQRAHLARSEQERLQLADLRATLAHVHQYSPYWSHVISPDLLDEVASHAQTPAELLRHLPILTRSTVAAERDALQAIAPTMQASELAQTKTSGSTNEPVTVTIYSPLYQSIFDALTLMDWVWHRRKVNAKVAMFRRVVKDSDQAPAAVPLSYLGNFPPGVTRDLMAMDASDIVETIRVSRPDYLLLNPLSAELAARYAIAHGIEGVHIEQLITLGDRIDDAFRALIRRAFGAEVKDRYSCEEVGYIALQCPEHDWYHVVEPAVIVEIVNDAGEPCEIGEPGRVLVTSLINPAMPMIRYELGDVAEWGEPCDCGITWPVIRQIHGRVRRYITSPSGEPVYATFIDAPFADIDGLLEFRVVLHSDGLLFQYVSLAPLADEVLTQIADYLRTKLKHPWPVAMERVPRIAERGQWKRHEFETSNEPLPDNAGATRH